MTQNGKGRMEAVGAAAPESIPLGVSKTRSKVSLRPLPHRRARGVRQDRPPTVHLGVGLGRCRRKNEHEKVYQFSLRLKTSRSRCATRLSLMKKAWFWNPPFARHQDIDHILTAYELLMPCGALVPVLSSSPFSRTDRKSTVFRDWLDEVS